MKTGTNWEKLKKGVGPPTDFQDVLDDEYWKRLRKRKPRNGWKKPGSAGHHGPHGRKGPAEAGE